MDMVLRCELQLTRLLNKYPVRGSGKKAADSRRQQLLCLQRVLRQRLARVQAELLTLDLEKQEKRIDLESAGPWE